MGKHAKDIDDNQNNLVDQEEINDNLDLINESIDDNPNSDDVVDESDAIVSDAFITGDEENPSTFPDSPKQQNLEDKLEDMPESSKARLLDKQKAKKRRRKKIIIAVIVILLCLISVASAWAYSILNTSFEDDDEIRQELTQSNFDEPFYALLVGTDTREGKSYKLEDGRSDSCILVRVDPVNYIVTMISIPRDTKITIDGSTQKFNACYAAGGISATIKQVKKMMGVDISHYAEISFNGLTDMVDAVGGVEVDVPSAINDPKAGVNVPAGMQTLNGEQALAFSRSRNFADGDFTRTADQRILIDAMVKKAYKMDVSEMPNLLKAAKNFIKTDLRLGDMVGIATKFMTADKEMVIYQAMIPSYNAGENGVSYVATDKEALERMMKMVENGEDPLLVEIDSGAVVTSSRDSTELEERKKQYYAEHPDSPGRIANYKKSSTSTSKSSSSIQSNR